MSGVCAYSWRRESRYIVGMQSFLTGFRTQEVKRVFFVFFRHFFTLSVFLVL